MSIPRLLAITDGKKAGYVLALASLAVLELNIPLLRADESNSYLVLKANGLFTVTCPLFLYHS